MNEIFSKIGMIVYILMQIFIKVRNTNVFLVCTLYCKLVQQEARRNTVEDVYNELLPSDHFTLSFILKHKVSCIQYEVLWVKARAL